MSTQLDPLKTTAPDLHRFWFFVSTEKQWYDIIRECRSWFSRNWRGMAKVRKKLNPSNRTHIRIAPLPIWFEVPDPRFATWISIKFSIQVHSDAKYQSIHKSATA